MENVCIIKEDEQNAIPKMEGTKRTNITSEPINQPTPIKKKRLKNNNNERENITNSKTKQAK